MFEALKEALTALMFVTKDLSEATYKAFCEANKKLNELDRRISELEKKVGE